MKKDRNDYFIETDVLVDHLVNSKKEESYLEIIMQKGACYTSVINASELFYAVSNSEDEEIIKKLLSSLKVLGLHSRYSLSVPGYSQKVANYRDALICVISDVNKLPIVSLNPSKYISSGLMVINPKELRG